MEKRKKVIIILAVFILIGIIAYVSLGSEWFDRLFGEAQTALLTK